MAPLLSQCCQPQRTGVAMKSLNALLLGFAILIFSGCYTQLLIEEDGQVSTADETIETPVDPQPLPPLPPIVPIIPTPIPIDPIHPPVTGPIHPAPIIPDPKPPANDNPHRETGYNRDRLTSTSQDRDRNTGVIRPGTDPGTQQQSNTVTNLPVPQRGDLGTQPLVPQRPSQDNASSNHTGRR